ncbi:MAG TPA: beta-galactosidase [Herpetosiphonaceae bacterium]
MKQLMLTSMLLVTLLVSYTCSSAAPAPMPAAQTASTSVFGLNSHIASRYPDYGSLSRPAGLVKDLALGWVREDVQWSRVEPQPGRFDWSWHDKVFDLHRSTGVNIIGVIGPAVGWATPEPSDPGNGVSYFAPDPDRYAAFAKAVAARYKGKVQAWEIWNEPENGNFWKPAPDPAAYSRLLIQTYAAIKSVDPSVTVLSGGVVPFDPTFLNAVAAHGAWGSFDALSVHPYVDPFTPETAQIDVVGIKNVQTLAARYGSKPIWATEFGWGSGACERDPVGRTNEDQQANNLVRGGVLLRGAGAERVLWYNFKDPQQPCYGLVRGGGSGSDYGQLKPAAIALKVLSQQIGGAQPLGAQDVMPSQVVLSFDDARGWGAPFPVGKPPITASTEQVRSNASGRIIYEFTSADNDYVAFPRSENTPLPANTTRVGLWVYGDGSGHMLQARIADEQGEVLQYRLGYIGAPGWQFLSASLTGEVEPGNRITGGNGRLDGALRLRELIVDDSPNTATGSGRFFIDDFTAFQGTDVYVQRFAAGGEVVDVVWSPTGGTARIPSASASATVTQRDGGSASIRAENGTLNLSVGPAPIYVRHVPGSAAKPPTAPPSAGAPAPYNGAFATPNFQRVWERTDRPVAEGRLSQPRTWLWGPQPITAAHREPYANSPEGSRQVQYFDKSRMEINNPASGQVTNGLLVVEMITGRVQVGDDAFTDAAPAEQAVAGDPTQTNPQGPTYASFRSVAYPVNQAKAPNRVGQQVTATLRRDGSTGDDASLARYGVQLGSYDAALGHNVPRVFNDFFAQRGQIYEGGYRQGQVIDALFAVGLPISEPYWSRVNVGGVEKDVLMQAFQRRVLTYTPSNPPGFQVEMGNVGQHYLRWRYGQ